MLTNVNKALQLLAMAGALIIQSSPKVLAPQILRYFIGKAQMGAALTSLVYAAVLFIAVGLIGQAFVLYQVHLGQTIGWSVSNGVRSDLARHCLHLDMPFHNRRTPGEMIERVDGDVEALGVLLSEFAVHMASNCLLLLGVVTSLFIVDLRAGLSIAAFSL